jgi:hypothetical protein
MPHPAAFLRALLLSGALIIAVAAPAADWPIITRRGDTLYEGDQPFRFFGLAAPNLQANESQILPDFSNHFPDEFETRDVLDTFRRLGARATRTFSLSVYSPADGRMPAYLTARRTYNEEAFRCLDRVLALCHEYDVRLIIPVIASQSFGNIRGVDEFAAFAGKTKTGAFWTDADVKADYRHLLEYLVNRRNTVNGLRYRDEPAILAWQFGNEFYVFAPDRKLDPARWEAKVTAWTLEMAPFLRRLDPNHLIMEAGGDRAAYLASPDIDVMSTHLYEYWNRLTGLPTDLAALAREKRAECRGKKPLIIDEFGLGSIATVAALMKTIREEQIVGGLLWGVRGHRRDGGFFYHNEGGTPINSYHFPGFGSGSDYAETRMLDLLRREAFAIRGLGPPPLEKPAPAPVLFRVAGGGFTWRGSTGASHYTIERAGSADGPWTVVADGLADSVVGNVKEFEAKTDGQPLPLWFDELAVPGQTYVYRVRGCNAAGVTDWSPAL